MAPAIVANFYASYAKMGGALAQTVAKKIEQTAAEHTTWDASKVYNRVKDTFGSQPEDDEAVLKEKLEQDEQLVRNLEELVNASSSDGAGDRLQIMAGTVGIAYAQGARNHGAIAGVLEGAPPQPKSAPLENPTWSGKNTRFLERPERSSANDAHEEFDD